MAKVITVGIQKGGAAKTTTTGIISYLLSKKYRVLAIDMDSQGNLTQMLTEVDDIYVFKKKTILEAMKERDAEKYIVKVTDTLHVIPSTDLLSTFAHYLYNNKSAGFNSSLILKETLESVQDQYDYILIDTPPALGEQTINAIASSDYILTMFESSKFCHTALPRFFETITHVRLQLNPNIKLLGIIRTLIDNRRTDNKYLVNLIDEELPGLSFENVITRTASVGRISIMGFVGNSELSSALSIYVKLVDELLDRIEKDDFEKFNIMIEDKLMKEWADADDEE